MATRKTVTKAKPKRISLKDLLIAMIESADSNTHWDIYTTIAQCMDFTSFKNYMKIISF